MAYVDSTGKTHISLSEASSGYAATHTASRDVAGTVIGDSTGSRYVREQEAQKAAVTQQQQTATYQQQAASAIQQAGTPNYNIFQQQQQQQTQKGFLSRTREALKQGYSAGEGKGFSLSGLKAPISQNTYTNSIYQKTADLSKRYDGAQNSFLSFMGPGTAKDFVTGVTNVPQIAIETAGAVPYGLEAIGRNPSSISDSISFGLGAMGGFMVEKARTHPAELAGELIASYGLAKGAGKIAPSIKESASITGTKINKAASVPSLKAFVNNERASLGPGQQLAFKERSAAAEPKIENYIVAGDKLAPESSFKINSIKLDSSVKLTPEMEEVLFGKKAQNTGAIKEATAADNFITIKNKIPSEETSITINSIKLRSDVELTPEMENVLFGKKAQKEQYVISSAKLGSDVKLTPEMENVLFRKSKSEEAFNPQKLDTKLRRNIFSPELTKPTQYKINNIVMEGSSFSFPLAASFSSALAYNVPEQKQDNKLVSIDLPKIDPLTKPIQDPIINPLTKPIQDPIINPLTKPIQDPITNPIVDPIKIPNIDPVNPDPVNPNIDPFIPDPFIPNIDPIIITNKIVLPGGGDFDLLGPQPKTQKGKRKTKNKMTKNVYGDPFKIKL